MRFDDLGHTVAGTLSDVFGSRHTFERPNTHKSEISAVIRRNVETLDDSGNMVMIARTARLARRDIPFRPRRGDRLLAAGTDKTTIYTLGRVLFDDGYVIECEIT